MIYRLPAFIGLFLVLLAFTPHLMFTGPSHIDAQIRPLAINDKGEILCRTYYSENRMGAHAPMKEEYGFCVISQKGIREYSDITLDPKDFPDESDYYDKFKVLQQVFKSYKEGQPLENLGNVGDGLVKKYGFTMRNVERYKVDKEKPFAELNKRVNLIKIKQKALKGAQSTRYFKDGKLHIEYDFGKVLLLKNECYYHELEERKAGVGANFNYYNPWTNPEGKKVNIGFDLINVTGVLFLL